MSKPIILFLLMLDILNYMILPIQEKNVRILMAIAADSAFSITIGKAECLFAF